jgi:hypothetical protein
VSAGTLHKKCPEHILRDRVGGVASWIELPNELISFGKHAGAGLADDSCSE